MGIFVGIGNYIGRVRQIGDGGGQPIGPNDYYIITEDGIAVLTERGKHILLDKYVTEDEIATWVKEHMVFWYDMSKPADVYTQNFNDWRPHPSVNADTIITSTSFVITRFATLNDTVKCYIPDQTKNFPGMKVEVKGIVDGQELYWGYSADVKLVNITQDGTYDIPPLGTVRGNLSFRNGNIVGACNITITQLPSGQSVPTNEILKANPYLQDFSGNNRPLKLNNFLFAAMSGVGGYETNFSDNSIWISSPQHGNLINNHTYNPMLKGSSSGLYTATGSVKVKFKATVTGMKSGYRLEFGSGDVAPSDKSIYEDGEYEFGSGDVAVPYGFKLYSDDYSTPDTDVMIELKELYPNALVTDGVDDYGQIQNLQHGVKVLFMTANPLGLYKTWYAQDSFSIYGQPGITAYNFRNTGGVTYLDGILNEAEVSNNLLNKKQTVTIVNPTDGGNNSIIFFNSYGSSYMNMAFYNSIGFDAVPEGNVTLQRVINYVINNILNKA